MIYEDKKYFLIKGSLEGKYIVGTNKSYLLTNEKGYTLQKVLPSSSFLIINDNKITKCNFILDISEEKKNEERIFNNLLHQMNKVNFQLDHKLGDKELKEIINKFKLIEYENNLYKIKYKEMYNCILYYHTLIYTKGNVLEELKDYDVIMKKYLLENVKGTVEEVCVFYMLKCWEEGTFVDCVNEISEVIYHKIDKEKLIGIIMNEEMYSVAKECILNYLYSNN